MWAHLRSPPLSAATGAVTLLGSATHLLLSPLLDRIRRWKGEHVNTQIDAANASSPKTQLDSAILKPSKRSMSFYHGSSLAWWSDSAHLYLLSQTSSGARGARYWSPKTSMRWLLPCNPNDGWDAPKFVKLGLENACFYHSWALLLCLWSLWGRSCCSVVLRSSLHLHHGYFLLVRQR